MVNLFCAIASDPGAVFEVQIDGKASVSALKYAIKNEKKKKLRNVNADDLVLFLAKKEKGEGAWLTVEDVATLHNDLAYQNYKLMKSILSLENDENFGEDFKPGEGQVHVLVKVPLSHSERQWEELLRSLSWKELLRSLSWEELLRSLSWKDTTRLCSSHGSTWEYQGKSELVETLVQPLVGHYNAWKRGSEDKQTHTLHLVMSGPGTGKSRMLDEMKGLMYEAAVRSEDQTLIDRMEKSYVFRVTFENGTQSTGSLFNPAIPELDISYRMLYQLWTGDTTFGRFSFDLERLSESDHHFRIEDVIDILAKLEKKDVKEMTVILCVDGFQQLMSDGSKDCALYRVMRSLCGFVNSSRAFAVCVCSATIEKPISEALAGSPQKRLYLVPPALDGEKIFETGTPAQKLLVGDMGGHGRALEILDLVLREQTVAMEELDPVSVIRKLNGKLRLVYSGLFDRGVFTPAVCKELVSAIISQRRYDVTDTIGGLTVDKLRSFGLFRLTSEGRLECAFIFLVELMRRLPTLENHTNLDEYITRAVTTWQPFERFVGFYRKIKSIAFHDTPILLSKFHVGARFGKIDCVITERSPRELVQAVSQHDTNSGSRVSSVTISEYGYEKISNMDINGANMNTIIINGANSSDLFMGIELTTSSGQQVQCNEVIQCKFAHTKINEDTYFKEREKAVDDSDVFLLITSSPVDEFDLPPRCGIVSIDDFPQYFGPFASRAFQSLLAPPDINVAEGSGDTTVGRIVKERAKRKRE